LNIAQATMTFIIVEFSIIFSWFVVVTRIKDIINFMVTGVDIAEVTVVGQNVVNGINVLFIILVLVFIGWYAYMAHILTHETSYLLGPQQYRRM
jgi:hypothetical protein